MRDARGFTLVEILIAMVILAIVIVGMASATGGFVRSVAEDDLRATAVQMADDRLETVLMDPAYDGLGTYAGVETAFAGLAGFTRETQVVRVGGPNQSVDYHTITVIVNGPGLLTPVRRTSTVAPTTGAQ